MFTVCDHCGESLVYFSTDKTSATKIPDEGYEIVNRIYRCTCGKEKTVPIRRHLSLPCPS